MNSRSIIGLVVLTTSVSIFAQPLMQIKRAVEVSFTTESGKLYQVYVSSDGTDWIAREEVIQGTGNPEKLIYYTESHVLQYYKVEVLAENDSPVLGRDYNVPEIGLELVWIEPGTFLMGSPDREKHNLPIEGPVTQVTITQPYWIGRYELTQGQYLSVAGTNPSRFQGNPELPVESVTWSEAMSFCQALTGIERQQNRIPAGYEYRLPTEAEWERACRAGTTTRFSYGDDLFYSQLSEYAWSFENSKAQPHPVGLKLANPWGLFDMHGNIMEICYGWYSSSHPGGSVTDPIGPKAGTLHVGRGGVWAGNGATCRSAVRKSLRVGEGFGFRVVLAPELL